MRLYKHSFTGVVVLSTLLHICVCVCINMHISINISIYLSMSNREDKDKTNKILTLNFLAFKQWDIQSIFYSEQFSPLKIIYVFLERNGKIRKTTGQTVEKFSGRYLKAGFWNVWFGSQATWRLSQSPGAYHPAQPLRVSEQL